MLQEVIGPDEDADERLNIAPTIAINRVVVKRLAYAGFVAEIKTDTSL